MNPGELRIGNRIEYTSNQKFNGIFDEEFARYIFDVRDEWEFLKPIPLTEEWFLKPDFIKGKDDYIGMGIVFRKNGVSIYQNDDNLFSLYNYNERRVYLKYVHQMQNLYFVLTGEEL